MPSKSAVRFLSAALFVFPALALAGASGVGIPETGGQGAGASSADARGLASNPAAAAGRTEVAADAGFMMLSANYQRAPYHGASTTADPDRSFAPVDTQSMAVVPYFGVR